MQTKRIKNLTANLANQIAAGEVVARPASVFKETVENSLDANASKIEILVENGGLGLLEIRDNGDGIEKEDLQLAITRHATSKIQTLQDLEQVASFGFRGEALASISAVSHFELLSCAKGKNSAWRLSFDPTTNESKISEQARTQGTSLIVKDLFFNTPARRKFLRSERTEFSHIEKAMRQFALAFAHVAFKLQHNGKIIWDLYNQDFTSRCAKILGEEFINTGNSVDEISERWRLRGFVGSPHLAKSTTDGQYFFVNNRPVSDRVISHAIKQAYKDVMYGNKHPVFVLFLDLPPEDVDVNVHPTKHEVRFRQANQIHSFIYRALHKVIGQPLANMQNTQSIQNMQNEQYVASEIPAITNAIPTTSEEENLLGEYLQEYSTEQNNFNAQTPVGFLKISENKLQHKFENSQPSNFFAQKSTNKKYIPTSLAKIDASVFGEAFKQELPVPDIFEKPMPTSATDQILAKDAPNQLDDFSHQQMQVANTQIPPMGFAIGQIKNTFILAENAEGLIIVDMHAAHERIIYEELKQQLQTEKTLVKQKLLFPLELELPSHLVETAEENLQNLQEIGLDISIASATKIELISYPTLLQQNNAIALLTEVLTEIHEFDSHISWQNNLDRCLVSMSCQGAWRTGKQLNIQQMNYLLRKMETTPNSDKCCHGRLTWHQFNLNQLNAFFKRGR